MRRYQFHQNFYLVLLVILTMGVGFSCNEAEKLNLPKIDIPTEVTYSGVSAEGKTTVTIPLISLGLESNEIEGVTIDVLQNSNLVFNDIKATDYYNQDYDAVIFSISGVNETDEISLSVSVGDEAPLGFNGSLSASQSTTANPSFVVD